ncbi:hypothetical protein D3C79_824050 [compost metagenome]
MAGDQRISVGLVRFRQVDIEDHLDTTEGNTTRFARIELTFAGCLQGHVVVRRVGDLELRAAGEGDGVRLATAEAIVVLGAAGDLAIGQADPAVIHCRRGQLGLAAAGVQRLFEHAVATLVGGHAEHVTDLQVQGALVALVGIGAIGITHVRRGIATGTGEQVLAVFITAVHQVVELLFELGQLLGIGLSVGVGVAAAAGTDGQFLDPRQDVGNAVEGRLGGAQAVAHVGDVAIVLVD